MLFEKLNINVFRLGPMFIAFGIAWLLFLCLFWMQHPSAFWAGVLISVLSLWYLPVGTLFSLVVLALLVYARPRLGI